MIVKLDKNSATYEGIFTYILHYSEDRFNIYSDRREKVRFLGIKHDKNLNFLDMLELGYREIGIFYVGIKKQ